MESNNSKALKSGVWYTFSNFLTKSIGMITTPIFTRLLSQDEFGLYNNYTSWLIIITIFSTLNLGSTFISARFDFKDKFDEYILSVLSLSSLSSIIWLILLNIFRTFSVSFFGMDSIYINCMMVYLIFLPAIDMFQSRERYRYEYKISVLVSSIITVGTALLSVLLVVVLKDRLKGRILGSIIPTIFLGLIIYLYLIKKGKTIKIKYWKYALPICLPYIPHLLSLNILNSVDRIMITKICGAGDNALYSLAYTCASVISVLLVSLNTAYSPWLGEKLNLQSYSEVRNFSKVYIIIFSVLAFGIMLISPEIIMILGGKSYMEAKYVMPPVMLGCVFQFLYTMFVNIEQFYKKTIGMAIASVSAAVLNYLLNYLFIPKYGYIAAAYTTLISFLWLLIMHMILVKLIGHENIYDYRFIILIISVMTFMTIAINILYKANVIRYMILGLYIFILVFVVYRYRNDIVRILKIKSK